MAVLAGLRDGQEYMKLRRSTGLSIEEMRDPVREGRSQKHQSQGTEAF